MNYLWQQDSEFTPTFYSDYNLFEKILLFPNTQENTGQEASTLDSQTAGGEELVGVGVGADAGKFDISGRKTFRQ